jgi:hypothetical protein
VLSPRKVRHPEILPEGAAQLGDPLKRTRKPALVARHAAVFPQERPDFVIVIVDGSCSIPMNAMETR